MDLAFRRRRGGVLLATQLVAWLGSACGSELELSPSEGSSFGNFAVKATGPALESFSDPLTVSVAGIPAYAVTRDARDQVHFMVQGAPNPGRALVVISGPNGKVNSTFTYRSPAHPALARLVAMGASLTMGVQDGGLSLHSQTHAVAGQFAAAAGAYLSFALVNDGIMPALLPTDFDPSTCHLPGGQDPLQLLIQRGLSQALPKLEDASGAVHIDRARIDADLEVRDVAIGGFRINQVTSGGSGFFEVIMEHALWDPFVDPALLFNPTAQTMLDRVVALNPTLVISTDLFVNDIDNVDLSTSGIPDLSALTPLPVFQTALTKILQALDGTGAQYFLATSPDVTLLPQYPAKVAALEAASYTPADATAWLLAIRQRTLDMNAALVASASDHPNLHVVDLYAFFTDALTNGVDIAGTHLSPAPMGGLVSLDGMHLSDTGYGVMAQKYVDAVNGALGSSIPSIDMAAVMAHDPDSVQALQAAGLTCAGH